MGATSTRAFQYLWGWDRLSENLAAGYASPVRSADSKTPTKQDRFRTPLDAIDAFGNNTAMVVVKP